ncbi:biopolymer transporter ExbD [Pararhodobacter sp. SW119]|uniref:ExbD/TolR family protein n=1 Tax=Pararhodobacter sp. SW119 TaxID=2780075 RepID=UPI001AE01CDB|nr:biopolymer transporter ExbD [Pararhodobacter sp. SW119]
MNLRRPPPRTPAETIVAMIDVVFFLLVFFMLIGRMDATAPFAVIPPLGLSGEDLPAGGTLVAIDESGRHALDGVEMPADAIVAELARRAGETGATPVRVNADRAAPLGQVLPFLARLEAAGLRDIGLVVTPNPP